MVLAKVSKPNLQLSVAGVISYFHKMDFYKTIERPATAEFSDRGSKFLAYCFPITDVSNFKAHLQTLKKEHPKATHHCFAYRIGTDGNTFRVSDGGEPSGSAGRPILGQIDSKSLTDTLVVVVRYFGGTMLGIPGLIEAYKTASVMALQLTPTITKQIEITYKLSFDYTQINKVMTILKQYNCSVIDQQMQLFCEIKIGVPKNRVTDILYKLKNIANLEMQHLN